jgi:hypothetical protein
LLEVLVFLHDNGLASGHSRGRVSEYCNYPTQQLNRQQNGGKIENLNETN